MVALAIGQMGLELETFLRLTPGQFEAAWLKFVEAKKEDREARELNEWQVARWQVWRTMCPPKKKTISQFDLVELPGDEELKAYLKKEQKKKQVRTPGQKEQDEKRFRALVKKWSNG